MQSAPHFVRLLRVPPRIDTRIVFRVYAAVAIVIGVNVTGTGCRGISVPGITHAYASIIWISGMAIVAAGLAACGLALNDDPIGRQRSLRWFAAGHVLLGLMAWMQWAIYWRLQGFPLPVALSPLLTGVVLFALAHRYRSSEESPIATDSRIRSTYDEHIRQIARREERARLARDLHDAVKQQLFVIQTAAATAQTRFDDDSEGAREALAQVRAAAREATTEMEALLEELQAAPTENTGLVEALKKQCEALALRTGADVSFHPGAMPPVGTMKPGAHEAIYRVAQEALANVARHARARHVTVSLQASAARLELRVSDNGTGIDPAAPRRGMGIANMTARAAEIGGRVLVTPASPGTDVVLSVPLRHPAILRAWVSAAAWALLALSELVFYGIRGASSDLRLSLLILALFAVWVGIRFALAYRKAWREKWP